MSVILGIDPGDTTGFSFVDEQNGLVIRLDEGAIPFARMVPWLHEWLPGDAMPEVIICEDFQLYGGKAKQQIGSRFVACQVIGMLKYLAQTWDVPLILQPASIKTIAEKFSGRKPEGAHSNSHHVDAYNHAIFWLAKQDRFLIPGTSAHPDFRNSGVVHPD